MAMNQATTIDLHCMSTGLYRGVPLIGFTEPQKEIVRALMSRIPPQLMTNVSRVIADRAMGAKHGRFEPDSGTVRMNPKMFSLRVRLGKGQGWIQHDELTMCHEFGHSVFESLSDAQKAAWRKISGWKQTSEDEDGYAPRYVEKRPGWPALTSEWIHKKGVGFTRHYAEKSPDEDFADSFGFYILGKPFQMDKQKRAFMDKLVRANVTKYPKASVQGPVRAY